MQPPDGVPLDCGDLVLEGAQHLQVCGGYKTVTEPARQPEGLAQGQAQEGGLGGTSIPHRLQVRKADRRRSGELG